MFNNGSRYAAVADGVYQDSQGRQIPYKLLRLIPAPPTLRIHQVRPEDRLDLIANQYFADPEQYWRICDANQAAWPEDLTREAGRMLRIPLVQR